MRFSDFGVGHDMTRNVQAATLFALYLFFGLAMLTLVPLRVVAQTAVQETGPTPEDQVPQAIRAALDAPGRPAADKSLDAGRRPEQVMTFLGIKPGMCVADLYAGAGYTTEILARIVGPTGKVYSQNAAFEPRFKRIEDTWHTRLKSSNLNNVVAVNAPFDADNFLPVEPNSLDAVIINLNYHDLIWRGVNRDKLNSTVFRDLKPGGVYGIIDSSAQAGSGTRDVKTLHRIDEQFLIKEVEKAGFKLAAASNVLRHPDDDRTWIVFKHRGSQDRFVLKFVKPQS
jgi:predicted methyltransferase